MADQQEIQDAINAIEDNNQKLNTPAIVREPMNLINDTLFGSYTNPSNLSPNFGYRALPSVFIQNETIVVNLFCVATNSGINRGDLLFTIITDREVNIPNDSFIRGGITTNRILRVYSDQSNPNAVFVEYYDTVFNDFWAAGANAFFDFTIPY